jgi:hypothetical protein
MTNITRYVNVGPTVTRKVVTGSSITINNGGGGNADGINLDPPLNGYGPTVQDAIAKLVNESDDDLPSGGGAGEVLGVTQLSPRTLSWVNTIDGGTFN